MPIVNLITPDGRLNRGAILLDARRQFRLMGALGWDWPQCLRFAWSRARAMQHNLLIERRDADLSSRCEDSE